MSSESELDTTVGCTPDQHWTHLAELSVELLTDHNLTDIVLIAKGEIPYWAHKLILCAGSQVFKDMFMGKSQEKVTTITLDHIEAYHLQSILEFLYLGETCVLLDKLPDLMRAAKSLEIKDFHVGGDEADEVFQEEISLADRIEKASLRGEEDCEPVRGSSNVGKRKRSSLPEEIPGPSTSSPSPVTRRSERRKNKDEIKEDDSVKKVKVEESPTTSTPNTSREKVKKGSCPICNKAMKFSVLEKHAGETETDQC